MRSKREELAAYAHNAWRGWMMYLFSKCTNSSVKDGDMVIPKESVDRWKRQVATPYFDLTEEEKKSDRKEADIILSIVGKDE